MLKVSPEVEESLKELLVLLDQAEIKTPRDGEVVMEEIRGTSSEMVGALRMIVEAYIAIKNDTEEERTERNDQFDAALRDLRNLIDSRLGELRGKDGKTPTVEEVTELIRPLIPVPVPGKTPTAEEITAIIVPLIPQPIKGDNGSPDTTEDIVRKLSPEKLPIDAVKDLRKILDELEKKIRRLGSGGSGGGAVFAQTRGAVKIYDISDQLNGVKKTFSLPSFGLILDVKASSSPQPMLQGVEYTVDGAAMTITFTSDVDETTTLSQGQRIVILYAEN